jgi:hypothetical protein
MERFSLKLNVVGGRDQYHVEISNRFTALENLDTEVDINRALETIRGNIKISTKERPGYYELKKHNRGLMKDAQNYLTEGNKPNCSGYRFETK